MGRLFAGLFLLTMLFSAPAAAAPAEVGRAIPNAQKVGEAHYRLLAVPLFSAALWTSSGAFAWERPFALSLTYHQSSRADELVNRSIREMSQRGAGNASRLAPLRAQLARCLPDLARGDRITGFSTGPDTARFFHNGAPRCQVRWPGFRRSFFGIWLAGRDGAAARLSAQLRGEA